MLTAKVFFRFPLLKRSSKSTFIRAFSNTVSVHTSDTEFDSARQWLRNFNESVIPKTVGDVSYSRSSGPGGQNVNKYACFQPSRMYLTTLPE
jgi:protein subunit release factor B